MEREEVNESGAQQMGVSKMHFRRSNVKNKVERKMMAKAQCCTSGQRNKHLDLRGKWGVDKDSGLVTGYISRHMYDHE